MSGDALGNWQTMLSDEFLQHGLQPVAPASYDPDRDIWSRSYSAGHAVNNQLVVVLVEVLGIEIVRAIQVGRLREKVIETVRNCADKYTRRALGEPVVLRAD